MLERSRRMLPGLLCLLAVSLAGCATAIKPPRLDVERLKVGGVRVTSLGLEVGFLLQNTNPEALHIARMEYDLELAGHRLGTGYFTEPIDLAGFGQARVTSPFSINFLSVPGTVKAILDGDRAQVRVTGSFYVGPENSLKRLRFSHQAEVPLGR